MPPTLRLATPQDAAAIAQLVRLAWHDRVHPSSSGHQESPERVLTDLQKGWAWVAESQGQTVGSVRLVPHPNESGVAEIKKLGVAPTQRKLGLGPQLMQTLEAFALDQGLRELRLAVRHDQPRLVQWYGQLGYTLNPKLHYSSANPLTPAPFVLHKFLEVSP